MKFLPIQSRCIPRKRPYLLLEALISFALVALCLFPLIRPHVAMIQMESSFNETMQLQRISNNFFYDLKTLLYMNQDWKWEDLKKGCSGKIAEPRKIYYKNKEVDYICNYHITAEDTTRKTSGEKYLLLDIELILSSPHNSKNSKTFKYALLVKNHAP